MEFITILVVWIFGSILAGKLAERKGLRGQTYILISVLLSPLVGLIAAAVAAPNEKAVEQTRLATGTERKCPACAEVVKAEAKVCRFCGRDLPPLPPMPVPQKERKFRNHEEWLAWKAAGEPPESESEARKKKQAEADFYGP